MCIITETWTISNAIFSKTTPISCHKNKKWSIFHQLSSNNNKNWQLFSHSIGPFKTIWPLNNLDKAKQKPNNRLQKFDTFLCMPISASNWIIEAILLGSRHKNKWAHKEITWTCLASHYSVISFFSSFYLSLSTSGLFNGSRIF